MKNREVPKASFRMKLNAIRWILLGKPVLFRLDLHGPIYNMYGDKDPYFNGAIPFEKNTLVTGCAVGTEKPTKGW